MRSSDHAMTGSTGRRLRTAWVVVLSSLVAAVLLCGASAQAALVHPFLGTVSKTKKGFSPEVCGISIDPATGQIYVSDPEAGASEIPSIEEFDSSGVFIQKITGHGTPEEEFEGACSTAVNDKNKVLYVADGGGLAIYPFDSEGKFEGKKEEGKPKKGNFETITGAETPAGSFEEALRIDVNQKTGHLYVSDFENEAVDIFSEQGVYESQLPLPGGEHRPGAIAIKQDTGEVFVAAEGQELGSEEQEEEPQEEWFIDVFSASGEFLRQISGEAANGFPGFGREATASVVISGLAFAPDGSLYVSDAWQRAVYEFDSSGAYLGEISGTPSGRFSEPFGVAVSASNQVYVVDRTEEVNVELPGQVDVFGPAELGAPTVESESVSNLTATSATLNAEIDPTGTDTTFHFELCTGNPSSCVAIPALPGTDIGAGEATVSVSVPAQNLQANTGYSYRVVALYGPGKENTVTGAEQTFRTKTEGVGLELPDNRGWEMVSPASKNGASFEAIPREGGLIQASTDGSSLTYIGTSPTESKPEGNRSPTFTQSLAHRVHNGEGALEWSSKDIAIPNAKPQGVISQGEQEYQFFSPDLSLALVEPVIISSRAEPPLAPNATERTSYIRHNEGCQPAPSSCYEALLTDETVTSDPQTEFGSFFVGNHFAAATPDLSHVMVESNLALTTEPAASANNLYEWSAGKPVGERLELINVLPGKLGEPQVPGEPGLPGEAVAAKLGGIENGRRHAISNDGSRVVWSNGEHLYMRDTSTNETVRLDLPEPGAILGPREEARYQTASVDGSKIFFTDSQRLTADSTANPEPPPVGRFDLYEYDVNKPTEKLTDLSVDPTVLKSGQHEHGAVQGIVPGASDDGTTVYFVANGILTTSSNPGGEKATSGNCVAIVHPFGATCNLYVRQLDSQTQKWEPTKFIASLSTEDSPDWQLPNEGFLSNLTSRVSPNGEYIAFMSDRSLTGYDNRDENPAAKGARDEEVFLYGPGGLACISCNPSGARPRGVFDHEEADEGLGLLVDRPETWPENFGTGRWLAGNLPGWTNVTQRLSLYQSRYLSDEGRLFFNSADPLVSQVTTQTRHEQIAGKDVEVGVENVYEFEPNGVGSCGAANGCVSLLSSGTSERESAFLDASESGNDVFLLTTARLAIPDQDSNLDVYDAHVCGAEGCIPYKEVTSTSCNSAAECKSGGTATTPSFGTPASVTGNSSGNLGPQSAVLPSKVVQKQTVKKLTRAQQLAKAMKACKKLKKKNKRTACEKQARKKFGAKKASKKSKKKKKGKK